MNVRFCFAGLSFEWDDLKARKNRDKHDVSFESACEVFLDPLLHFFGTNEENDKTQAVIGETSDEHLLFVVHIVKEGGVIRLISARAATAHERREYEN